MPAHDSMQNAVAGEGLRRGQKSGHFDWYWGKAEGAWRYLVLQRLMGAYSSGLGSGAWIEVEVTRG